MSGAKVRVDSFWGDLANSLLLSPPFREVAQPAKDSDQKCNCGNGPSS